jgi:uncharacterized protein YqhQ
MEYLFVNLIIAVIVFVVPGWIIVNKAGFRGVWSLLILLPIVNVIALWLFALMRWPSQGQDIETINK